MIACATLQHPSAAAALQAGARVFSAALALPFDRVRAQYAQAARLGLVQRSLIQSAQFERGLSALEDLALGPFARKPE